MNTQFKLIGFDLDGTLVNSLPDLALSVNSALTEFSLPQASEELVLTWIGNGAPVLIARALDWACAQSGRELTASEIEKVKARFNFYYGENLCNVSRLYPNVKETLENLKEKGYTLAVVTNKPTRHVQPVLAAFSIDYLAKCLVDNHYQRSNPIQGHFIIYVENSVLNLAKYFLLVILKMIFLLHTQQVAPLSD